jgi:hypothetical protein
MHTSHFWQSAGLIAIIFGAAVLSAMIGSRAHAAAQRKNVADFARRARQFATQSRATGGSCRFRERRDVGDDRKIFLTPPSSS